ncbi:E3 ubiquitin-protein ligase RNF128 [Drosophila biarmipes]|uniref:E3 ubiquitin-protein ligase RNF128 n=1 Tax=Drosophila biarmipes TaxID=125945 RepID=UPI0007E84CCA|nr:E3 ubiquitin-protein ligase RNF128 [Drosophila biarmipes]
MSYNSVICTICSERYRPSENIFAGFCGHVFHEECLDRWREQSPTCPICRGEDLRYFQLYLDFEVAAPEGDAPQNGGGSGSGGGRNRSQGQSDSSGRSSSKSSPVSGTSDYAGIMREYENLLYETGVYQDEIEYLNERIGALTLRNSQLSGLPAELDSDAD